MSEDRWLSIAEAAAVIGVHPRTLRRYIKDGKLRVSRVSSQVVRISRNDIDDFLRANVAANEAPVEVHPSPGTPAANAIKREVTVGRFG